MHNQSQVSSQPGGGGGDAHITAAASRTLCRPPHGSSPTTEHRHLPPRLPSGAPTPLRWACGRCDSFLVVPTLFRCSHEAYVSACMCFWGSCVFACFRACVPVFLRACVPPPTASCCPATTQDVLASFLRHAPTVSAAVQILNVVLLFLDPGRPVCLQGAWTLLQGLACLCGCIWGGGSAAEEEDEGGAVS